MTYKSRDFGEMTITDNATATTISSQNSWVKVTNFSSGVTNNVTFSSNELTVTRNGNYKVSSSGAAIPASSSTTFEFGVFVSDSLVSKSKLPRRLATTNEQTWAITGLVIGLTNNDTISLRVRNLDGTSNVTISDAGFVVEQL